MANTEDGEFRLIRSSSIKKIKQAKFLAGDKPTKRTKNFANEEALYNLFLGYFHRSPIDFLKGVAHRFTLS